MNPEILGVIAGTAVFGIAFGVAGIHGHASRRRVRSRFEPVSSKRRVFTLPARYPAFGLVIAASATGAGGVGLIVDGIGLAILATFAAAVVCLSVRNRRRRMRLQAYNRNLLRVLDVIVLSLRSGAGLVAGLREAAAARDGAVERDLKEVVRLLDLGVGLEQALHAWTQRCPLRSVRLAVACVTLAHKTGGSSAKSIGTVRTTVRNAMVAESSVQTHSAQARASATALAAMPFVISGPMLMFNETARVFMLHSSVGLSLLFVGLLLDVMGMWWMSSLIVRTQS